MDDDAIGALLALQHAIKACWVAGVKEADIEQACRLYLLKAAVSVLR